MYEGSSGPVASGDVSSGGSAGSGRDGRVREEMDVGAGLGLTILSPAAACPCPGRVGTGDIGKMEDMGETGSGSVAASASSARE